MRTANEIILIAFIAQADAIDVFVNHTATTHAFKADFSDYQERFVDKLIDKIFDLVLIARILPRLAKARPDANLSKMLHAQTSQAAPARLLSSVQTQENPLERFLPWRRISISHDCKANDSAIQTKYQRIKPYKHERPQFDQDPTVRKALAENEVWRGQSLVDGRALAEGVLDVKASPSVVWSQLFDFSSYPGKVPVACGADVYRNHQGAQKLLGRLKARAEESKNKLRAAPESQSVTKKPPNAFQLQFQMSQSWLEHFPFTNSHNSSGGGNSLQDTVGRLPDTGVPGFVGNLANCQPERVSVKFQSAVVPGIKLTAYCNLDYQPAKNSATFGLDPEMKHSFDEVQGHWHIIPHPDGSSNTRVFYEMGLTVPRWLPQVLVHQLSQYVVKDATQWLKTESERELKD